MSAPAEQSRTNGTYRYANEGRCQMSETSSFDRFSFFPSLWEGLGEGLRSNNIFYLIGGGVNSVSIIEMAFEGFRSTLTPPSKTKHKTRRKHSHNNHQREAKFAARGLATA